MYDIPDVLRLIIYRIPRGVFLVFGHFLFIGGALVIIARAMCRVLSAIHVVHLFPVVYSLAFAVLSILLCYKQATESTPTTRTRKIFTTTRFGLTATHSEFVRHAVDSPGRPTQCGDYIKKTGEVRPLGLPVPRMHEKERPPAKCIRPMLSEKNSDRVDQNTLEEEKIKSGYSIQ